MRVEIKITNDFGTDDEIIHETAVVSDMEETIDEVFLVLVRVLLGHGYSESLIQKYINYSPEDWKVYKI